MEKVRTTGGGLKKGKLKGKSPSISRRNQEIRSTYEKLLIDGKQPRNAKKLLAGKYYLAYDTIENILYRIG